MKKRKILSTVLAVALILAACVGLTQILPLSGTAEERSYGETVELFDEKVPMVPVPRRVRIVHRDNASDGVYADLPDEEVPMAKSPAQAQDSVPAAADNSRGALWAMLGLTVCVAVLLGTRRRSRA